MSEYMLVEVAQGLMEVVARTKYDALQAQLAQCERDKDAAVRVSKDFMRGFEEARQQIDTLEQQLAQAKRDADSQHAQLVQASKGAEEAAQYIRELHERLAQAEKERDEYERRLKLTCHEHGALLIQHHDLTQERDRLKAERDWLKETDHAALVALVQEVLNAGIEFEDPRISYKTIQLDKTWFDDAKAALEVRRGME